jgi:hypothetical protein
MGEFMDDHVMFIVVGGTTYDGNTDTFISTFVATPANIILGEN